MPPVIRAKDHSGATPLTHLQLKTVRAEKYLDEVDAVLRKLFDPEPYAVTRQDYPKKFLHVIRIQSKGIPIEVPLLIGDFAYNLRSGLDQLAWVCGTLTRFAKLSGGQSSSNLMDGSTDLCKFTPPYSYSICNRLKKWEHENIFGGILIRARIRRNP